ncbi:MAG TPA: hypothetical protein VGU71_19055, partial [Candidatus Dormibacteraeota bacterium]|nr:hypothetical protein [Candidatus Dormibacteraeota bacterium]
FVARYAHTRRVRSSTSQANDSSMMSNCSALPKPGHPSASIKPRAVQTSIARGNPDLEDEDAGLAEV